MTTKGRKGVTKPIPVAARNIFTGEVLYFKSCGEAARKLKIAESSIRACKDGKRIRAGMYTFKKIEIVDYRIMDPFEIAAIENKEKREAYLREIDSAFPPQDILEKEGK